MSADPNDLGSNTTGNIYSIFPLKVTCCSFILGRIWNCRFKIAIASHLFE